MEKIPGQPLKLTQEEIQSPLKKKNNIRGFILPDFNTCYKATLFQVVWYWYKDRQISNGIEKTPEIIQQMDYWVN